MIKNCRVLINNDAVTAFEYDGVEVQIPSIKREARFVKVKFDNGKYTVVDDNYVEDEPKNFDTKADKKKPFKKTTLNDNAEDVNE